MAATFNEDDWRNLTAADKKALKIIPRYSAGDFEIIAKMAGLGQPSMDSLVAKGLAVEGEPSALHGRRFKMTDKGWLAVEWLAGRRPLSYPPV